MTLISLATPRILAAPLRALAIAGLLSCVTQAESVQAQELLELTFEGKVEPVRKVAVANRIDGVIDEVLITGGEVVEAEQLLFVIDSELYEIELAAVRAALDAALARLKQAEAAAERLADLRDRGTGTAVQAFDARMSAAIAAADLAARQSELARAERNLAHTRIKAPISGRLGRPQVAPGAFVEAEAGSVLAEIVQLDPVLVAYEVPYEDRQAALAHAGTSATSALFRQVELELELPGGQVHAHSGVPRFESAEVDQATGNLTTWALFPNPDTVLLPGLDVRIRATVRAAGNTR